MRLENNILYGQVWIPKEKSVYFKSFIRDLKEDDDLI